MDIRYNQLEYVLNKAVAGFAHVYSYGDSKCTLISQLLGRPVNNLVDFNCPSPRYFRAKFSSTKSCHINTTFRCATRHSHFLYQWLMYHFQRMSCYLPWQDASYCPIRFWRIKWICYHHSFRDAITTTSYTQRPLNLSGDRRSSFRSNRVLLRRAFLNDDKSRCVGRIYPAQNYQPLVEFRGTRLLPLVLPAEYGNIVAERLPGLVESNVSERTLCGGLRTRSLEWIAQGRKDCYIYTR